MKLRKERKEKASKIALQEAVQGLEKAQERSPEVTAVASSMRSLRERNHFAERLQAIMGGPR